MSSTTNPKAVSGSHAINAYETLYHLHVEKPQPLAAPTNEAANPQPRTVVRRRYRRTVSR